MVGFLLQVKQEGTPTREGQGNDLNNANDLIPVLLGCTLQGGGELCKDRAQFVKVGRWQGQVVPEGVNAPPQDLLLGRPGFVSATEF